MPAAERQIDFADLARQFSADSHAKEGGVWKDVNPQEAFRPEIAQTIAALKVGQVSKLVDLDGWGFIVRKDAETGAQELSFAEAYDEIERNVKQRLGKEAYREWVQRLRDAAFIKIYPFPEDK